MKHRRKTLGLVAAVVAVAITAWLVVPLAISTAAPRSTSSLTATHTGRFTDIPVKGITSGGDRLVGSLDISRFGVFKGNMKALGRLDGKVKNSAGKVIGGVLNKKVRLPVLSIDGTSPGTLAKNKICRILHLKLGPIHLNLLGLHIDTNTIIINITAHRGPGNLLGNLLCAIAHLLDNPPAPKGPTANILTAVAKFTSGMRQLS